MNMLYDSESFVVVHFQSEALAAVDFRMGVESIRMDGEPIRIEGELIAAGVAQTPAVAREHDPGAESGAVASAPTPSEPQVPRLARHGFEIVDKRSGKEIYLDGSWAELFQEQIVAWQRNTPTQEEVEDTLDRYAALAHQPVTLH
jgi:hypothetical protein